MSNDGDVYEVWGILGHKDDPNIPRPVPFNKLSASTDELSTPTPIQATKPVASSQPKLPNPSTSLLRYPIVQFKRNLIPQLHENSLRGALRGAWIDLGQDALPKPASPAASQSTTSSPTQSNDYSPINQCSDAGPRVVKPVVKELSASNQARKSPVVGGGRFIEPQVNTARMRAAPYNLAARKILLPAPPSSNAPASSRDVRHHTACLAEEPANRKPQPSQSTNARKSPEQGRSRAAKVTNAPIVPAQSLDRGESGLIAQPRALNARLCAAPYDVAAAAHKISQKALGPSSTSDSNALSTNDSRNLSNRTAASNPFSPTFPPRPTQPEIISTNVQSYGRTIISPTSSVSGPLSATENSNRTPSSLEASNPYSMTFPGVTSNHTSSSLEASNPFSVTSDTNMVESPATASDSCQTPTEEEGGQFKLGQVTDWSAFPEIEGVWTQEDEDAKALFAETPYEEQEVEGQKIYTWGENAMDGTSTGGDVDWGT
ncbi:hypothetical protein C8R47DRAFT_660668 [Mycena vitilis]|nr:hypothetical protein C8R47DRAFT_660668 [Mycena vitilis]